MRRLLLAAMMFGAAASAHAADMPDFLRGGFSDAPAPRAVSWGGAYIGGQASYGGADMDFKDSGKDLLARLLNNVDVEQQFNISQWPLGQKNSSQNSGFGGFVGYNFQSSEALFGVELNYIHGKFNGVSSGDQTRVFMFPTDYYTTAMIHSDSSMRVKDYGSLRVRGGYAVGSFLPYAFLGVALGQADINRYASYDLKYKYIGTQVPALPDIPATGTSRASLSDNANAHFIYGYAAGLGVDVMLFSNLFLRAEWEYLRFTAPVDTTINTVRGGLGYKF